ncbi:MAG: hypothetical protein FJ038_12525 [Chloroflexi bacterium]|nr:hypothetical protein [Chloroflexota bacterium]
MPRPAALPPPPRPPRRRLRGALRRPVGRCICRPDDGCRADARCQPGARRPGAGLPDVQRQPRPDGRGPGSGACGPRRDPLDAPDARAGPLGSDRDRWTMYLVAGDRHVVALDITTGTPRWQSSDAGYAGTRAAADDRLFVLREDGSMAALAMATGDQIWKAAGAFLPDSSPLVVDGLVLAGGSDFRLRALDAATGAERWAATTVGALPRGPSTADGRVHIGSSDGGVHAFDARRGAAVARADARPGARDDGRPGRRCLRLRRQRGRHGDALRAGRRVRPRALAVPQSGHVHAFAVRRRPRRLPGRRRGRHLRRLGRGWIAPVEARSDDD